jgi:heme/copper-type cytochrome/quinol oxidase subunit 2
MFQDSMMSQLERTRGVFAVEHLSFEYFAVKSFYEYMSTFCPYASVTNFLMGLILAGQQTPAQNSGLDEIAYRTDISRRSQYRSIKRGASNMVRLHATGAMALPVCSRLHIFASSRDVIHSWAIPSAGIKIDCIPGFSSHRMAYFISTGIF